MTANHIESAWVYTGLNPGPRKEGRSGWKGGHSVPNYLFQVSYSASVGRYDQASAGPNGGGAQSSPEARGQGGAFWMTFGDYDLVGIHR